MFLRVVLDFLTKESLILSALKQKILDESRQSNGKNTTKIYLFIIICKYLSLIGNFCWKLPSKITNNFYLKHQKYPFCEPNLHPIYETESYGCQTNGPTLDLGLAWIIHINIRITCYGQTEEGRTKCCLEREKPVKSVYSSLVMFSCDVFILARVKTWKMSKETQPCLGGMIN